MDTRSDHWTVRGDSMDAVLEELAQEDHADLVATLVNTRMNDFVARYADFDHEEAGDTHGHGKRIPYIGWYWRATDWVHRDIPIADCGDFVGVCENNKWGYPQRDLTPDEANAAIDIVWQAMKLSQAGGNVRDIEANTKAKLDELWLLFQTFHIAERVTP